MAALFGAVLLVETVRVYKPQPAVYALVTDSFDLRPQDVVFVFSKRWDVMGAASFGFKPSSRRPVSCLAVRPLRLTPRDGARPSLPDPSAHSRSAVW